MTLRGASVLLVALLVSSCGGTGRAAPAANATTRYTPEPAATPLIDVNDMMGAFPPATFFVVGKDGVKAIALLNHATKYTISVSGKDPQVAAAGASGRVYVLDQASDGARLRWFDLDNGTERASRVLAGATVAGTGIGHGALVVDATIGIVYTLLRERDGIAVESFDWFTLRPARQIFSQFRCGERLTAAAGRVAVACLSEGGIVIDDGGPSFKLRADFPLVAMAMLGDGTLMAGAADGRLVRLARHETELEPINALKDYGARLVPDGIAVNAGCCFYFGILDPQANDVQVRAIAGGTMLVAFPTISAPTGGLFVQSPFAYFVVAGRARHVDINQGFGEVMADVGEGAVPGAVANR